MPAPEALTGRTAHRRAFEGRQKGCERAAIERPVGHGLRNSVPHNFVQSRTLAHAALVMKSGRWLFDRKPFHVNLRSVPPFN